MSLAVVVKGAEGLVLAADSRVTVTATISAPSGTPIPAFPLNFDNASKLLSFKHEAHGFVGAVTYGNAVIGLRTAHSFLPELEPKLGEKRLTVEEYANQFSAFYLEQWEKAMKAMSGGGTAWKGPDMTFLVAGYDEGDFYGKVFLFGIPNSVKPQPKHQNDSDFGMTWGGQTQVVSRLVSASDPILEDLVKRHFSPTEDVMNKFRKELHECAGIQIPYQILPLQDCVDLAIFLIRTTMTAQNLAVTMRGVGGPIDVAYITRTQPLTFIQQKQIQGEAQFCPIMER